MLEFAAKAHRHALAIIGFSYVYAIVRYHLFEMVPLRHFPLYINNKAIAMASVIIFAWAIYARVRSLKDDAYKLYSTVLFGITFFLASLHVFISVILLDKAYYGKFYLLNRLNILGEFSLLFGTLAFIFLAITMMSRIDSLKPVLPFISMSRGIPRAIYLIPALFTLLHLAVMGGMQYKLGIWPGSWFILHRWAGGIPPISLVAFLALFAVFLYFILRVVIQKQDRDGQDA